MWLCPRRPATPCCTSSGALTLFAMQRYKEAAATLYAVLSVGPGWDWTTMIDLYPSEESTRGSCARSKGMSARTRTRPRDTFVLAYQYMTTEHPDEAAKQFERVVQLVPNDDVSKQMLTLWPVPTPSSPVRSPTNNPFRRQVRVPRMPIRSQSRGRPDWTLERAESGRRERRLVSRRRRPLHLEVHPDRQHAGVRRKVRLGRQHARAGLRQRRNDGGQTRRKGARTGLPFKWSAARQTTQELVFARNAGLR